MKAKSFEEKLEYSKKLLDKLMDQDITLEESVKLYEEGLKNIKEAQQLIEEAKMKTEVIQKETIGTSL